MEKVIAGIEKKKALLKGSFGMVFILLVIILAVFVASGDTFGWFAQNHDVEGDGMSVISGGTPITAEYFYRGAGETEYSPVTDWAELFSGLTPGDTVTLKAVYTNPSSQSYFGELYLTPGADGEKPLEVDTDKDGAIDEYYYLGSQIRVESVIINEDKDNATALNAFLVENSGQEISKSSPAAVGDTSLISDLPIPAGDGTNNGQVIVEIVFRFVNFPVNQNAYKAFGASANGEKCSRILVLMPY